MYTGFFEIDPSDAIRRKHTVLFPSRVWWTWIFQDRLCYPWEHLQKIQMQKALPPEYYPSDINHVFLGWVGKTQPTRQKRGLGKWISLQTFLSLEVVFLAFHSGEDALPSWGPGILSFTERAVCFANPADQVQHCSPWEDRLLHHRAWDQTVVAILHTISAGFNRQLLGGIWQAFFTRMCKHIQGLPHKW